MKKIITMLLALCMMASTVACSSGDNESSSVSDSNSSEAQTNSTTVEKQDVGGLQLPLTDETEELTVWCVYNNNAVPDPNDLKGVQELERRTNVHINWIPVTTSEASEKQGILFSSGDLPDIMYAASFTYPGGLAKGVEDGVIADMDPLIREYDGWYAFACANTTYTMGQTTNPDVYFQAITNPVLKPGDEPVQCSQRIIAKDPIYITTACEKPELAAQWLDYWWSDEGTYLSWYGIEGETYELDEEGTPEFTELVTNNPDGLAPSDVLYQYAFNSGSWFGKHDVEQGWKMANIINNSEDNIQLDSTAIFSAPETNLWLTSSLAFTDAEGVELTSLQTAVNTLIEEYMVNYINGNDSTSFDDFRETLSSYGMDRIVEIYQAAYDRYLAR